MTHENTPFERAVNGRGQAVRISGKAANNRWSFFVLEGAAVRLGAPGRHLVVRRELVERAGEVARQGRLRDQSDDVEVD